MPPDIKKKVSELGNYVNLLRPPCGAKQFSMSKIVFINLNVGVQS